VKREEFNLKIGAPSGFFASNCGLETYICQRATRV